MFDQAMALPYHLYVLATQHPDIEKVRPMQYGTALVLISLVFGINICAIYLRSYFRKRYRWWLLKSFLTKLRLVQKD